jgi:hypothetical protein
MIRNEIAEFVQLWNGHKIRSQPNRPHVVSGVPYDLYSTDKKPNWGVAFTEDDECGRAVHTMMESVEDVNIDDFLTPETEQWCEERLREMEFNPSSLTDEDHVRPHLQIYLRLRDLIQNHLDQDAMPRLEMVPVRTGGVEEYVSYIIIYFYLTMANF